MLKKPPRTDGEYNEYVKDFYRKIEEYDWNYVVDNNIGLESFLHKYRRKKTLKLMKRYAHRGAILDAGCGTGLMLRELPAGSIGIDINPRNVAKAKKYVPQAIIEEGDVESLPFNNNSFDTVLCTEVLEHLVLPERAVNEFRRVLKPGGYLIGSIPTPSLIWHFRFLSSTHYHNEPFHSEFLKRDIQKILHPFSRVQLYRYCFLPMIFFVAKN